MGYIAVVPQKPGYGGSLAQISGLMMISGVTIGSNEIRERFEQGAVSFACLFKYVMNENDWSHPRLVTLCKIATGGDSWVHSSQIASLRLGKLKSPGPRSFASLVCLFHAIDAYQKGQDSPGNPDWSGHEEKIKDAIIIRDDDGNPASIGYLFEIFCGWRSPPERAVTRDYSEEQAALISSNAGKHVRRLLIAERMDVIDDMKRLKQAYSSDKESQEKFESVILGQAYWDNEEVEHSVTCLSHMLRKVFKEDRNSEELLEDLMK